jgi:hypothetical protein
MSDDRNDGWNHRSQFKDQNDPGLKTVTQNVNGGRHGIVEDYHAEGDNPSGSNPQQEPDEARGGRDWEDGFEARHLPNGKYEKASDERSNREKLLAGETV